MALRGQPAKLKVSRRRASLCFSLAEKEGRKEERCEAGAGPNGTLVMGQYLKSGSRQAGQLET